MCSNMNLQKEKITKQKKEKQSTYFRILLFAAIIGVFLYIIVVSYFQHQRYRSVESKLQDTYAQSITESMADAEHLYKLFGETDMVFRMFTLEFDHESYLLYRKNLDSLSHFIDSISAQTTKAALFSTDVQDGFELRNRYAQEFASLRKTLDDLILTNTNDHQILTQTAPTRSASNTSSDTVRHKLSQTESNQQQADTVVRKRQSLFNRIFRAKNDTIVISNEQRNRIEAERLEIMQINEGQSQATPLPSSSSSVLQSTFRKLQEKEKQLILSNFELLDNLKTSIEQMRELELTSIRNAESADFQNYQSQFIGFQRQLVIAILLLIALIGLLYYYQRKVRHWERQLEDEVVYSNNLVEEKTNLLTHIAHEIRSPLSALINITEMLGSQKQDLSETEKLLDQKKFTDSAHYHIRTVSNTITDILSLTKLEEGGLEEHSFTSDFFLPAKLVSEIVGIHGSYAATKDIEMKIKNTIDPRLKLKSNSFVIGQVLSNLLTNAIKYTESGGSVRIISSIWQEKGTDTFRIEVKDTGIGIAETDLKQVFKKYYTANPAKGFGLGLYLSKAMTEKLGGQISVKSILGEGSSFFIDIPVIESELSNSKDITTDDQNTVDLQSLPSGVRVLIVDDNPINLLYLKRLLQRANAVIYESITVRSAIEILNEEEVDLIITDIHLPDQSGWNLLKHVRSQDKLKDLSIYSTTASLSTPSTDGTFSFDGQLGKPFTEQDLVRLLQSYLQYSGK